MPEPIKNSFNQESLHQFAVNIQAAYQSFEVDQFLKSTMDETWDKLELKERIHKICETLKKYLPSDYTRAIEVIDAVVKGAESAISGFWIFPTFVELYGQHEVHWDVSINALARYTSYSTSEFAVRPFIIKHEARMMKQMSAWSKDENEHVRRLASEGCRPQLPWGQSLPKYKADPAPILPILEQLKADPSLYVRKSVANNLNDISKTHPDLVAKLAKEWYGDHEDTNWIVKHGCRTLLKKGNRDVLAIFGYHDGDQIEISDFGESKTVLSIGEENVFSFTIATKEATKVRLEYGIDYVKANGKRNRKIFQISEVTLKANERKSYAKKHSFADLSTRRHYPGKHSIVLIVNGVERETLDFELK